MGMLSIPTACWVMFPECGLPSALPFERFLAALTDVPRASGARLRLTTVVLVSMEVRAQRSEIWYLRLVRSQLCQNSKAVPSQSATVIQALPSKQVRLPGPSVKTRHV